MLPSRPYMRARDAAVPPSHSKRPASAMRPTATGYRRFPTNVVSSNDIHSSADSKRLNAPFRAAFVSPSGHTPLRPTTSRTLQRRGEHGRTRREDAGLRRRPSVFPSPHMLVPGKPVDGHFFNTGRRARATSPGRPDEAGYRNPALTLTVNNQRTIIQDTWAVAR